MLTAMMQSDKLEISKQRCIYENDEILVTHSMMNFPDGTSEAVMVVNQLKDGKVVRIGKVSNEDLNSKYFQE